MPFITRFSTTCWSCTRSPSTCGRHWQAPPVRSLRFGAFQLSQSKHLCTASFRIQRLLLGIRFRGQSRMRVTTSLARFPSRMMRCAASRASLSWACRRKAIEAKRPRWSRSRSGWFHLVRNGAGQLAHGHDTTDVREDLPEPGRNASDCSACPSDQARVTSKATATNVMSATTSVVPPENLKGPEL